MAGIVDAARWSSSSEATDKSSRFHNEASSKWLGRTLESAASMLSRTPGLLLSRSASSLLTTLR